MPCLCGDTQCPSCGPAQGCATTSPDQAFFDHLAVRFPDLDLEQLDAVVGCAIERGYNGTPINYDTLFATFPVLMPYRLSQVQPLIAFCMRIGQVMKQDDDRIDARYAALEEE